MATRPTRRTTRLRLCSVVAGTTLGVGFFYGGGGLPSTAEAQQQAAPSPDPPQANSSMELKPVESDPHHFMEYYNRPTFLRLKEAISGEPTNEQGWKSITSDALILAEAGNLLVMRPPEDRTAEWKTHAVALRQAGSELYHAAEEQEFAAARKAYETLVSKCNDCHDLFNRGKPNLRP